MRERSTWNRESVLKRAAVQKKADPYTMNQEHPQPASDKYVNGDPSAWAEDVHKPDDWAPEYSGGEVKRNEIGMPEMRPETMNHKEKTAASNELLVKRADICIKLASKVLSKKASESAIEDQAVAFMELSDAALIGTLDRLANDESGEQQQEAPAQDDAKQAQEQQETEQAAPAQEQKSATDQLLAAMASEPFKAAFAQLFAQHAGKQAQDGQQGQAQEPVPAQQQDAKQAAPVAPVAQQDQQQAAPPPAEDMQAADQALLDEMLASPEQQVQMPAAGMVDDIEMDSSGMDFDDSGLGPEDADLQMLFSANEEVQEAQKAQEQSRQAAVRTASTRTIGTKPTGGVSRLGGGPNTKVAGTDRNLESLWTSAPDVREHFGQK